MRKNKLEIFVFALILILIVVHGFLRHDNVAAVISAICGISYTFIAGKGKPVCYLFGLTGSGFYCYLSFMSALWGNLLLYALYYIPMQILGYFRWNKNLKTGTKNIIKISLPTKEMSILLVIMVLGMMGCFFILSYFKDLHPVLDSITTVLSIGGMYLTVRRAIQQWIFWMGVNLLSLIMWLNVALLGERVWSTVIMWAVYLFLAVYFYIIWRKEFKS